MSKDQALKELEKKDIKVNHLSLTTLFPVLKKPIIDLARNSDYIIIPEVNFGGQYAEIIRGTILEANPNCQIIKINSQADLISPQRIVTELEKHV
jgi:pyruvate/2-oxoacid:ferredoxin oxidoreductase alpha subunit